MFLTVSSPGTDLSYLLFKHPDRVQTFNLPVGRATVWYPRVDASGMQVALLVEVDSAALAKSHKFKINGFELGHFINDRAYAASSLLAVALGRVFSSALKGQEPADSPGRAAQVRPLSIAVPAVRSHGGAKLVHDLFEPLGWAVETRTNPQAPQIVPTKLTGNNTLQAALSHLYVLLPVLDNAKHYWVGPTEVDKLLRHAETWLGNHPARQLVTERYLAHQGSYVADAAARLLEDQPPDSDPAEVPQGTPRLVVQRRDALVERLRQSGVQRVLDLGCGEGHLL
ncbi:MAG: hypothetical protein LBO75_02260, partial [Bifidobacteriaceae bacterium]|nr:hypothetical protein [Bifidobacteriaceae bacterium]